MDSNVKIRAKDCIHLANDIIVVRNLLIPRLTSLKDIDYSFFVLIFEDIFGIDFFELSSIEPKSESQEIQLIARLLAFVSKDLFCVSLDHIKAEDLVQKDLVSIHDFLEIISTFIKYIPKQLNPNKSLSFESQFHSKAIQTNGSPNISFNDKYKTNHLFSTSDQLKYQSLLRSDSTSSSHSVDSTSSESKQSVLPLRRRSLRQTNSCVDCHKSNPKQESVKESKAIQTDLEIELKPKTVVSPKSDVSVKDISFDEYKRLKCENFATLLGHRLHETLKLKQMTDSIEYKIKRYYGDVNTKTPQRLATKSSAKIKSSRKPSIRPKKSPQIRKTLNILKPKQKTSSLDELIQTFPEIPRNTIKSLKAQEKQQKKVIENLNKDIFVNELKVKSKLSEAIESQQKRSKLISNEIKHLEILAQNKGSKLVKIKENAAKRDSRIERAKIHKMVDKFETDLNSKYKKLQAMEEKIVLNEYEKREKQRKDYINDFRKRIKERHGLEMDKQKQMLDALETLYQNKYQMLSENLNEEENRLKSEMSSQSYYLRSIKKSFNERFENEFKNIFNN